MQFAGPFTHGPRFHPLPPTVPMRDRLLLAALSLLAWGCAPLGGTRLDPADPDAGAVARCQRSDFAAERRCYEEVLLGRLRAEGPAAALALLDRMAAVDPEVRREGHMYAHGIGIAALQRPEEVGKVFASCTPAHQSGCYHGVVQSYFLATQRSGAEVTTETVDALCQAQRGPGGDPWLLFQCIHGLGHGLTILHGHDLPRALRSCDLISRASEREGCYAGAFMESIVNATHPHHLAAAGHAHHGHGAAPDSAHTPFKALDPADLHYPCSAVEAKYVDACYTIQTAAILHHTGQDVGRAARECGAAPERARTTCFVSLGRDVSGMAVGDDARTVRLCAQAPERYRAWCNVGVAQARVNLSADPAPGLAYCRAVPGAQGKGECYRAVGQMAVLLRGGTARREEACGRAEEGYVDVCRGAPPQRTGSQ